MSGTEVSRLLQTLSIISSMRLTVISVVQILLLSTTTETAISPEHTYYTQNAHGDVVNLTNANGEVTKTYKYNAFGGEKDISESDTNAFRYCGEYYDTESGTIYLRARYYDPSIGRFISRDSFAGKQGDPLSLNRYTYCHNSPVVFVDCNGNFPFYHS